VGPSGVIAGSVAAAGFASSQNWSIAIPPVAVIGRLGASIAVGTVAGLYPAARAARIFPTEALRTG
jgi:putative ABC transport system permease protein